jgi:hypothetical protein
VSGFGPGVLLDLDGKIMHKSKETLVLGCAGQRARYPTMITTIEESCLPIGDPHPESNRPLQPSGILKGHTTRVSVSPMHRCPMSISFLSSIIRIFCLTLVEREDY